ncbi:hypothetical protein CRE_00156 [Caenorhabditis remanei]|uniref:Uncharacterized protein n=1 Tax=Caenorhabditis remanei TaxID=31234 RepID=E3LDF8_CAERE|nr:hypothetical protein CRE_00156 [Caenorhabditis remanei]
MLNYPFPSPPVFYSTYKFDMNLNLINKVLFQTVLIAYKVDERLHFICLGIILPIAFVITTISSYVIFRTACMKHVRKIETTLVCYALIENILMQMFSTVFTVFYWTFGYAEFEEELGTTKFVCIFYLYCFNYLPLFCFNLVNCTIALLLLVYYRRTHPKLFGIELSNFNLRTFYVIIVNFALCDVLFIFCISWIAMAKNEEMRNYQTKCFVLLNPIFQRVLFGLLEVLIGFFQLKIVDLMKGLEWYTQIFTHSVPYFLCICFMLFGSYKIYQYHMIRREGAGIQLREKQRYGGVGLTLLVSIVFLTIDMVFNLYCDIYEIRLHYTNEGTNAEYFFFLKDCKTVITTVLYEKLPEPSEMKLLAWMYYKWCRCYFALCMFRKFLDKMEDCSIKRRQRKRQNKENKELKKEIKQKARNQQGCQSAKKETRIDIDINENVEHVSIVPNKSLPIRETAV